MSWKSKLVARAKAVGKTWSWMAMAAREQGINGAAHRWPIILLIYSSGQEGADEEDEVKEDEEEDGEKLVEVRAFQLSVSTISKGQRFVYIRNSCAGSPS